MMATGKRIASVDALRGFDMFFITGGALLIGGVCSALGCGNGWLAQQMHHVVDVRGRTKWTVLFDPVGKNSILVYTLMMVGVVGTLDKFLFTGVIGHAGAWSKAVEGLSLYLVAWSVASYFKRRGIFLKV